MCMYIYIWKYTFICICTYIYKPLCNSYEIHVFRLCPFGYNSWTFYSAHSQVTWSAKMLAQYVVGQPKKNNVPVHGLEFPVLSPPQWCLISLVQILDSTRPVASSIQWSYLKKKHVLATSPSFGSPSFGYPLLYIWPLGHSCPDQIPLSTLKNGHRSFGLNWIFAAQSLPSVKNPNFWLMFIVIPTYSKLTCLAWFCLKINYLHFSRQKINDLSEITIMLRGVPINMVIKFPKLPTFPSQTAKNYHLFPITAAPHAASWAAWRIVSWPRSSVPPGKVV
jgi:hypothetical protein